MKKLIWVLVLIFAFAPYGALAADVTLVFDMMLYDFPLSGQQEERIVDVGLAHDQADGTMYIELYDADREIYVCDAINEGFYLEDITLCAWPYGSLALEDQYKYRDGVDALYGLQLAYDFYEELGWKSPNGLGNCPIYVCTNVVMIKSEGQTGPIQTFNAFSSFQPADGVNTFRDTAQITMGTVDPIPAQSVHEEVMIHEYTHTVLMAKGISNTASEETAAVHEAYADVMALCAVKNGWEFPGFLGSRNLMDPEGSATTDPDGSSCIGHYDDYYDGMDEHDAGTILGHAAYLMYKGENSVSYMFDQPEGIEGIEDYDLLAELFFRSMDWLGNAPSMHDAGDAIRRAADIMGRTNTLNNEPVLTAEQVNCVDWALEQVGLGSTEDNTYSLTIPDEPFEMTVLDIYNRVYANYRAELYRPGEEEPSQIFDGTTGDIQIVYMDNSYHGGRLILKDQADSSRRMSFILDVDQSAAADEMMIQTYFGESDLYAEAARPTQAPQENGKTLENYLNSYLLPRYGHAAEGECDAEELEGILTSAIEDLDGDDLEELLLLRGEWADGMYRLQMEVYESDDEEISYGVVRAGSTVYLTDMIATDWYDVRAAFGLIEHQGAAYIVMYNYFSMNDNSESFVIYHYDEDEGIRRVGGSCIWTYWNGAQLMYNTGLHVERDAEPIFMYGMFDQDWEEIYAGYAQDDSATGSDRLRTEAIERYKSELNAWGIERKGDELLYSDDDYEKREKLTADELIFGGSLKWLGTLTSAPGWDHAAGTAFTLIEARDLSN